MSEDTTKNWTRRQWLGRCATCCGVAALGTASACGDYSFEPLRADVTLTLSEHPQLAAVDGIVRVDRADARYAFDIFVRRLDDGTFQALSAECPHESCGVRQSGDGFFCPCHSARFAADGTLLGGPAIADLKTFPVAVEGDTLTILAE